jgi:hypothetical protein
MMGEPFENTALGILALGVLSSLIATFIWTKIYQPTGDGKGIPWLRIIAISLAVLLLVTAASFLYMQIERVNPAQKPPAPRPNTLVWTATSSGAALPQQAVQGGYDSRVNPNQPTILYICRASLVGGIWPGKDFQGRCYIGWDGKNFPMNSYEVLVGSGEQWGPPAPGFSGALVAGRSDHNENVYICRVEYEKFGRQLGYALSNTCDVGLDAKELQIPAPFEVLYPPWIKPPPGGGGTPAAAPPHPLSGGKKATERPQSPGASPKPAPTSPTRPPASLVDLSGTWLATYTGGPLRASIQQIGTHVTATLLQGNDYVPAGKVTFDGTYDSARFRAKQVCAGRNYTNPQWATVEISVIDSNNMKEELAGSNCSGFPVTWYRVASSANATAPTPSGELHLRIVTVSASGAVRIDGFDPKRPVKRAFTWAWGDGTITQGWFPQSHTYARAVGEFLIKVTAHEDDGSTVVDQISTHF